MKKLQDERLIKKILLVFLALQPFLDCYLLYSDEVIGFFHFSPTTIIRMLIIAFLFLIVFLNKENKQIRKFVYIYGGIILLYTGLHHFVSVNVDNDGYKTFTYSLITEMFYIIRMILPIAMIYIAYCLKITKEEFIKLFLAISLIASSIIIIANIFLVGLASYGGGVIKGNIFDWFFNPRYYPQDLASKGWYNSANQISGLMFILLPICLYACLEKLNKKRIIISLMVVISMVMLGTRVASYGWLLLCLMMLGLYLFFCFIIKNVQFEKKKLLYLIAVILFGGLLITHAPIVSTGINHHEKSKEELKKMKEENVPLKTMLKYIGMNDVYYKVIYPYEEHKEFWRYVVEDVSAEKRVGNRNSQRLVIKDVGNTYETLSTSALGLGYSRFINSKLYLEQDFVIHYYTIGIFGILIFLLPYILIALYAFIKSLKSRKFDFYIVTLISMLILPLGVSFFSGHIIDELIVTIYMGFIAGYLFKYAKGLKNEKS